MANPVLPMPFKWFDSPPPQQ